MSDSSYPTKISWSSWECPCCHLVYETAEDYMRLGKAKACECGYGLHHNMRFDRVYDSSPTIKNLEVKE